MADQSNIKHQQIRKKAHAFLKDKGIKTLGQTHSSFRTEEWLTEFGTQLLDEIDEEKNQLSGLDKVKNEIFRRLKQGFYESPNEYPEDWKMHLVRLAFFAEDKEMPAQLIGQKDGSWDVRLYNIEKGEFETKSVTDKNSISDEEIVNYYNELVSHILKGDFLVYSS